MSGKAQARPTRRAVFRFYEELNDFLPPRRRKRSITHGFTGTPAVKDVIEALGVPHTEVDLILINGVSVDFAAHLHGGERVAVYPCFERLDISPITRLRPQPLRETKFIADVHLGKLARRLRMLGFDTHYQNDLGDATIIAIAVLEKRIVLTRDLGILKHKAVTHGYWLRTTETNAQLREVVRAFQLENILCPFSRCTRCNTVLRPVAKEVVWERLPPRVRQNRDRFAQCCGCDRIYWEGTHHRRMLGMIHDLVVLKPHR